MTAHGEPKAPLPPPIVPRCPVHDEQHIGVLVITTCDGGQRLRSRFLCAECLSGSALAALHAELKAETER